MKTLAERIQGKVFDKKGEQSERLWQLAISRTPPGEDAGKTVRRVCEQVAAGYPEERDWTTAVNQQLCYVGINGVNR